MDQVYQYLEDHDVHNYLRPIEMKEDDLIFPYLDKTMLSKDEKAKRLVLNLSLLQNKTTTYQEIDVDRVKEIYEEKKAHLSYLFSYYHDLQDMIETKVYMLPTEYFMIRNISLVYEAIDFSNRLLEKWYEKIKQKRITRKVYCHGKCELSHFLENENGYFISLENAHIGDVTEDITYLFDHHYMDIDLLSTYQLYQHKYPYKEEEQLFFFLNLATPIVMEIYPSSLSNIKQLNLFFDKLKKVGYFLSENQEKEKKNQKE